MDLFDEIRSSRTVGYRRVDPNRGTWEDMGIDEALRQPGLIVRFRKTMEFVAQTAPVQKLQDSSVLDSGEPNPFSRWLSNKYGITVINTPPELDFDHCNRSTLGVEKFDFIFALEILEHLMNPLSFLELLQTSLRKDGSLFLSTPFVRPRFLWSKYHITEYFPDKIQEMAAKAGLTVCRYRRTRFSSLKTGFLGIRPIFRLWYDRIMLFEMKKSS